MGSRSSLRRGGLLRPKSHPSRILLRSRRLLRSTQSFHLGLVVYILIAMQTGVDIAQSAAQDSTWALDLDRAEGDQKVRELNRVGPNEEIPIELVAKHMVSTTVGAEVVLGYDSTKVEPLTFKSVGRSGFMPYGPRLIENNTFTFAFISLTPRELGSGSMAEATFKTLTDFEGEATVTLIRAQFGDGDNFTNLESEPNVSIRVRSGGVRTTDFDGNGDVGFSDFIYFAQNFGREKLDSDFNIRYDLNANGSVDFADFVLFAQSYGSTI
jgi:hypothetical protein